MSDPILLTRLRQIKNGQRELYQAHSPRKQCYITEIDPDSRTVTLTHDSGETFQESFTDIRASYFISTLLNDQRTISQYAGK